MTRTTRAWIAALESHLRFRIDPEAPSHAAMIRDVEAALRAPRCPDCPHPPHDGGACALGCSCLTHREERP